METIQVLPTYSNMLSIHSTSPIKEADGNKIILISRCQSIDYSKLLPIKVNYDTVNTLKEITLYDEVDNPPLERSITNAGKKNIKLFETMKHEMNRLNSFAGKWPLIHIKPKDLAESGFFYLQSEDKVQCAFCYVILHSWRVADKPLKEHLKRSPKCPFLMRSNVGNVPLPRPKCNTVFLPKPLPSESFHSVSGPTYKPKHPRMSETKNRLLTYKDWPLIMLSPKQLTECGLYYTGVADVVTCFFCGGSLGNWELDDDPWVEHTKFFPHCTYLNLVKKQQNSNGTVHAASTSQKVHHTVSPPQFKPNDSLHSEIVRQACEIFSPTLVQQVMLDRLKEGGPRPSSLQELCDQVLEHKEKETMSRMRSFDLNKSTKVANSDPVEKKADEVRKKDIKDALLCKICMDQEMGIVFQPCGHLVSCPKCAMLLFNCPLCRIPITNKVRTYLS